MKIIDFYASDDKAHWLSEIKKSDWGAGKYLYELLRDQKLKELCGEWAKVLLLVDDERLISFCTYAEQDDVREPSLTPWVGFVYTFPEYREKRRVGKLLEYAYKLAKNDGHKHIYISTGETGTAIIAEAIDYLQSTGKTSVRLAIDKGNPQSTHFWKKNGFEIISEADVNGWTKLVAEKSLIT